MRFLLILPSGDVTIPVEPFVSIGTPILVAFVTGCFGLLYLWAKPKFERIESQTAAPATTQVDGLDRDDWLVREVGGIRSDLRHLGQRVDTITNRFNDHLDKGN
jgi:hypothetical protein